MIIQDKIECKNKKFPKQFINKSNNAPIVQQTLDTVHLYNRSYYNHEKFHTSQSQHLLLMPQLSIFESPFPFIPILPSYLGLLHILQHFNHFISRIHKLVIFHSILQNLSLPFEIYRQNYGICVVVFENNFVIIRPRKIKCEHLINVYFSKIFDRSSISTNAYKDMLVFLRILRCGNISILVHHQNIDLHVRNCMLLRVPSNQVRCPIIDWDVELLSNIKFSSLFQTFKFLGNPRMQFLLDLIQLLVFVLSFLFFNLLLIGFVLELYLNRDMMFISVGLIFFFRVYICFFCKLSFFFIGMGFRILNFLWNRLFRNLILFDILSVIKSIKILIFCNSSAGDDIKLSHNHYCKEQRNFVHGQAYSLQTIFIYFQIKNWESFTCVDMSEINILYFIQQKISLMQKNWSDQVKLGQLTLKNRVVMAAMTRQRCDPIKGVQTDLVKQYYTQRSGAGMILTEATAWCQRGQAFPGAANLYNKEQAEGWKKVIDSVHQKGGKIFLQIFNAGRATHQKLTRGLQVQGPSAIAIRQEIRAIPGVNYPVPKEMSLQDIQQTKKEYEESIKLAKQCQFDGIQLHGAHGYLIDSFLRSYSNRRTDKYGGSVENRCRFCLELVDITAKYFSAQRIGIKISPASRLRDMFDQKPEQTFSYLLKELDARKIGFVEIRESTEDFPVQHYFQISAKDQMPNICKVLRPFFKGVIIANDAFDPQTGLQKINSGQADMISFARLYISNPDLAERILNKQEVNKNWDRTTFFGHTHAEKGFTDYKRYGQ